MLNTLHLQTFLAVVETSNYSNAAEQLHMSQPAVSQHIRALEAQLGAVRLFRRVGQHMVLTHAGEELIQAAREMLALSERTEDSIRALRGQISGRVTLGCTVSGGEMLLPPLLAAFHSLFPAITVSVVVAPLEALLEAMTTQHIHLLLAEEHHRRRGWESQLLGSERLVLVAPRGHALLQQEQVAPTTLREEWLVLPGANHPLRRTIEDGLRRRGVGMADIRVAVETDSHGLTLQAVRNGIGLAFLPQSHLPRGRELAVVDLAGMHLQQEWYLVRSRDRGAPRAVSELFSFITGPDGRRLLAKEGVSVQS